MIDVYGAVAGFAVFVAILALAGLLSERKLHLAYAEMAHRSDARIAELEDRLQSGSLSEFRAHRPVAMQANTAEPTVDYLYDDTGLVQLEAPVE